MKCNEFRTKLQEIKTLKKEFDFEFDDARKIRNLNNAKEIMHSIEMGLAELKEVLEQSVDKFSLFTRKKYFEKFDAKYVGAFYEGIAVVEKKDEKQFFIDKKGNKLFEGKEFRKANNFSEGLSVVYDENESYYIDKSGGRLFKDKDFRARGNFKNGLACVVKEIPNRDKYKFYFINKQGEIIFNNDGYEGAVDFSEGLAGVSDENGSFYINEDGEDVFGGVRFNQCQSFAEGYASVSRKEDNFTWRRINLKGDFCSEKSRNSIVFHDGVAWLEYLNNMRELIDLNGKTLIEPKKFQSVTNFHCGMSGVWDGRDYYFIDKHGKILFDGKKFEGSIYGTNEGLFKVYDDPNHCYYMDKDGRKIFE